MNASRVGWLVLFLSSCVEMEGVAIEPTQPSLEEEAPDAIVAPPDAGKPESGPRGLSIVFDGNSLVAGAYDAIPMPYRAASLAPLRGAGASITIAARDAQDWRMMSADAADVDGAWQQGKNNVLVLWEATNSIVWYGRSVDECMQDLVEYIAARRALHPWQVVLLTTIPRSTPADAQLRAWNARARADYPAWGVDVLVDTRRPPLGFDGEDAAGFASTQPLWAETSAWVHLSDDGQQVVAGWLAEALHELL